MNKYEDKNNQIKIIYLDGDEITINIAPHKKIKEIHLTKEFNENCTFNYCYKRKVVNE